MTNPAFVAGTSFQKNRSVVACYALSSRSFRWMQNAFSEKKLHAILSAGHFPPIQPLAFRGKGVFPQDR
jgi:hypothetical protein